MFSRFQSLFLDQPPCACPGERVAIEVHVLYEYSHSAIEDVSFIARRIGVRCRLFFRPGHTGESGNFVSSSCWW